MVSSTKCLKAIMLYKNALILRETKKTNYNQTHFVSDHRDV